MRPPLQSKVTYFPGESREYIAENISLVRERALERGVKKVCVFTDQGEGALEAARQFADTPVSLFAVTFPANRYVREMVDGGPVARKVGINDPNVRRQLIEANITIVQGTLPFEEILIPGASDLKTVAVRHALRLFGFGMELCIQAILMLCDAGHVEPREEVLSCSADTAILATASTSSLLFSPYEGMEIREVISKPRVHTGTRFGLHADADEKEPAGS